VRRLLPDPSPLRRRQHLRPRFQLLPRHVYEQPARSRRPGVVHRLRRDAERNFSKRLAELTKMRVSKDPSGEPNHIGVRLTDPELFQCNYISLTAIASYLGSALCRSL